MLCDTHHPRYHRRHLRTGCALGRILKRLSISDPCGKNGGPKDHAAVNFKCARIKIGMRHLIAPGIKELPHNIRDASASTHVLDREVWVRRVEGLLPRHRHLNHPYLSVPREQCHSVFAEKGMGNVLVEFGAICQVMIEPVDQSSSRECQMHLAFATSRKAVGSMLFKSGIKLLRDGVPIGVLR